MAKKLIMPRTSAGFQKKIDAMLAAGITTRQDALDYATLMVGSIELEMKKLESAADRPMVAMLIWKYKDLKARWDQKLKYCMEHINDPIEN